MELMGKTLDFGKTQLEMSREEYAAKGMAIYESVKGQYEPHANGKFLTIDIESSRVVMSETLDDAADLAEKERRSGQMPFFIVKIGDIVVGQM